ncbi:hypothetical protein CJ030_MR8G016248 [Morella rubra]|uniref:Uncharacterized protein n=1 Tax=Morella rubra TaxID=262757 RepID=A0A6A1UPX4_9ROSI|nr:hypothetical protein CJ030_MR8G016248 [Morella rubra]
MGYISDMTIRVPSLRDETPLQTTPSTQRTRKTIRVPSLCDETPSQPTPSTQTTRQIPQLRDETPSQPNGQPPCVPLTRSRRLSQLLSGIVKDNAVAAVS